MRPSLSSVIAFLAATGRAAGEIIGEDICSCSPSNYEFTLDFGLTCPPVNITLNDAISATSCFVGPFGDPTVMDLIPVSVQTIDILELDQNLQVMVQENIEGDFEDGDTFSYSSIAASPENIEVATDVPRALQLNIIGLNNLGENIINVYLITFSNDCGAFPVFTEGQSAGWTRFTSLDWPHNELCPASPATSGPTRSPSLPPPPTLPPVGTDVPTYMSMSMEEFATIGDWGTGRERETKKAKKTKATKAAKAKLTKKGGSDTKAAKVEKGKGMKDSKKGKGERGGKASQENSTSEAKAAEVLKSVHHDGGKWRGVPGN